MVVVIIPLLSRIPYPAYGIMELGKSVKAGPP